MKQAYFLIAVNDDGSLFIDYETAANVLPDGAIYNKITGEWESEFEHATFFKSVSGQLGDYLRDLTIKGESE